jgi:hypothetical protein
MSEDKQKKRASAVITELLNMRLIFCLSALVFSSLAAAQDGATEDFNSMNAATVQKAINEIRSINELPQKNAFEKNDDYKARISNSPNNSQKDYLDISLYVSLPQKVAFGQEGFDLEYAPEIQSYIFILPRNGEYVIATDVEAVGNYIGSTAFGVTTMVSVLDSLRYELQIENPNQWRQIRASHLISTNGSGKDKISGLTLDRPCVRTPDELEVWLFGGDRFLGNVESCLSALKFPIRSDEALVISSDLVVKLDIRIANRRSSVEEDVIRVPPRLNFRTDLSSHIFRVKYSLKQISFVNYGTGEVLSQHDPDQISESVSTLLYDLLHEEPIRMERFRAKKFGVRDGYAELEMNLVDARYPDCSAAFDGCSKVGDFNVLELRCHDKNKAIMDCPTSLMEALKEYVGELAYRERNNGYSSSVTKSRTILHRVVFD